MSSQMTVTFPGGKKVDASYNGFTIATDQAVDAGGDGSAPEPFDFFLSSIATCTGIYVLGFCQKRGIRTRGFRSSRAGSETRKAGASRPSASRSRSHPVSLRSTTRRSSAPQINVQ